MKCLKASARLIAATVMVALVVPVTVEFAQAQAQGKDDGARKGRGGGGGGDRGRSGGGGGGGRPEVRSAPSVPRFSPSPRPSFTPPPRVERPAYRAPQVRARPAQQQFSRPAPELQRLPPAARRFDAPRTVRPPSIERRPPPNVRRAYRPWRPGLRWRYIAVPTIIIAEDLEWCHYHRWRVSGMLFHRDVRCHQHTDWDHPSLRYVEGY